MPAGPAANWNRRVRAVLVCCGSVATADDPRFRLWGARRRSGLPQRLVNLGACGGSPMRAARTDAVTALFDAHEQFITANPGAGIAALLDHRRVAPAGARGRTGAHPTPCRC